MAKSVEDRDGMLPGSASQFDTAGRQMHFAEHHELIGLVVSMAELPVKLDRLVTAANCLLVVAKFVVSTGDAIQGVRLVVSRADFPLQLEGPLTDVQSEGIFAQPVMEPAH